MVCPTMQTGFLISLYCFHCSGLARGGTVSHYTRERRSRRSFGKRGKHGLSARSYADRHRTRTLPLVGRSALFSRAQRVISVGDVLARIRQHLISQDACRQGRATESLTRRTRILSIAYLDLIYIPARQFCAITEDRKTSVTTKRISLIDLQIISLNKRLRYVLLMQR